MEGKQNTPSKEEAAAARNSCGTTKRRFESSCFSKLERNTPAQTVDGPLPHYQYHAIGLTWDRMVRNDTQ